MQDYTRAELRAAVAPYETPSLARGLWQIVSSLGFYLGTVALMYWSLGISYWLTLALSLPAAGLLIRVFIIQHDCGHGSFFAWKRGNDILGSICGVLTLAPYASWRRQHAGHHSNWNNLDRRESGADIYSACLTVEEYRARSPMSRFLYRLPRHPLIAHIVFPPLVFLLLYRVPFDTPKEWTRERRSVWFTNLAVAAAFVALGLALGFGAVLMVQLPIVVITTIVGVWLFSVQHRFETARWVRQPEWNFTDAAMKGSSYLALPSVLHWLTGNIGYHHIHHLSPRVPNYRLAACHRDNEVLRQEKPLSLKRALGAGNLALWDEAQNKLVRFRDAFRKEPHNQELGA
ncbi:MAG: fatty acid desaturase [Proteobacteria bacterium]|nr:fatty acid desaturase [Pseudomonadota bacterium]